VRKLGLSLTFWLAGILLSTNSFALGLGEIEVNSFLNQPLDAKIEVISERTGEIDDLLVTLATREAFERAGLSRPRSLSELRFKVEIDEATASAVVLVTTRTAVKEPFLNFLVEADWAKGRVLREFTVLLDPPFYANTPAPATTAAQTEPEVAPETPAEVASVGVIANNEPIASSESSQEPDPEPESANAGNDESEVIAATSTAAVAETSSSSVEAQPSTTQQESTTEPVVASTQTVSDSASEESEYITDQSDNMIVGDIEVFKGDTLWSIATQFKDPQHSMSQVMLALQQMNPDAFGDDNINLLKIGSVLRAPTMDQLDGYGEQEALAEVLEQNGLWDGYVEHISDSTAVSMAGDGDGSDSGADGSMSEEQGNLNLLAPGTGETDASGVQGGEDANEELSRQLAFAEEELDAARIENADLESRISELEATLSKVQELQKMVEIEDDSLAQLQSDQSEESAEAAVEQMEELSLESITTEESSTSTEAAEALTEEMNTVDEEALLEELLAEEASTEVETAAENGELEATDASDNMVSETIDEATQPIEVAEEQTSVTPPPAPVVVTETVDVSDSLLDGIIPAGMTDMIPSIGGLLGDPILLGGIGGVLILLLGLFGYRKWKSKQGFIDLGTSEAEEDSTNVDSEDLTPIQAVAETEEGTNIMMPNAGMSESEEAAAAQDDFSATEIISTDNVVEALAPEPPAAADPEPSAGEQDDTLNEVDVYLAYGLYDNAEDLLKQSLEASPGRADYRSKLLDTYFATKNVEEFVSQSEALKAMGDAASRYWDRVQVMGFELAPDNALFSGAKDSSLSASDLGIAKPEAADFDLGGDDDENSLGETDFLLTEGPGDTIDTQSFVETVARADEADEASAEIPAELSDDDMTDLEFAFDTDDEEAADDYAEAIVAADAEGMDFELPSDLDDTEVAEEAEELDEVSIDFDMDEALGLADESEVEDDTVQAMVDDAVQATVIIKPGEAPDLEDFEPVDPMEDRSETQLDGFGDDNDDTLSELVSDMDDVADVEALPSDISLGLDDTSDISDEILMDMEDQTDISDIDLGLDDLSSDEIEVDGEDIDLDLDSVKPAKTDTFAPGDFDDPEEIVLDETNIEGVNIDDIDDLVLPDDVDEVSTKLDLARAFIDMGDAEGARGSLDEVLNEGNDAQKAEAQELMKQV
jgi:pilus assembly protein FimV